VRYRLSWGGFHKARVFETCSVGCADEFVLAKMGEGVRDFVSL
jgi:hypothetical protein